MIKSSIRKQLSVLLATVVCLGIFAQEKNTDELYKLYNDKTQHDTVRFDALLKMATMVRNKNIDSSIAIYEFVLPQLLAKKMRKQEGAVYLGLGNSYKAKGEYIKALELTKKAQDIAAANNDQVGVAKTYNALGQIYGRLSDFRMATQCYLKNLEIYKSINKPELMGNAYQNLGNIYSRLGKFEESVSYHRKSLELARQQKKEEAISLAMTSIGECYKSLGKYDSAMILMKQAIPILKKSGDDNNLAISYSNLASLYSKINRNDSSIFYINMAIELARSMKAKASEVRLLTNKAEILLEQKNYREAAEVGYESLGPAQKGAELTSMARLYSFIHRAEKELGHTEKALKALEEFNRLNDSISRLNNKDDVSAITLRYDLKQKNLADSLQAAEAGKIVALQLKNEKNMRWAFVFGLILLGVFAVFMLNRYRVTSRQKKVIEQKEIETSRQKILIEEKQKEIVDSINYAKRIQNSLMASEKFLKANLQDYFICFKPKDIVSGDFYWASVLKNGNFAFLTADSTGHGVPGAMMSMLNMAAVNEAINERGLIDTAEILNYSRLKVIQSLSGDGSEDGGKDGMDCVLIILDKNRRQLQYSGANNGLCILRNGEMMQYKGNKMPVGRSPLENTPFTSEIIQLESGDMIYTFTDGIADQFGGVEGKKFKYKRLYALLSSVYTLSMSQQKEKLGAEFETWKGSLEQIDDVCVIGIKV